ncbi:MAG: DEAD/DEAH box helicase family protein [Clostridiales bacterium]|nr:DEAD/DEAH box helicase family protein [Clostridiales bacterium]
MKLRLYQQEAVDQTEAMIAFGSTNLILSAPTSWGKSIYISALCKTFPNDKIVIMINIEPLIDQIASTLKAMDIDYSILKAGRDKEFDESKRVQIVMSQTYYARSETINIKADKLIIDERHKEYDTPRTNLIIDELKPQCIIGCSATPYDSQAFALEDAEIIETATGQSLTDEGHLTPLRYYVPRWSEKIDYSRVKKHGNDYTTGALEEIINTPKHIELIIDSMNDLKAKDKKTLVFCSSISQADNIAEALKTNGYKAIAYHSKKTDKQNERVLESFRNNTPFVGSDEDVEGRHLFNDQMDDSWKEPITCLVSINKLAIGFDVPDIELGVIVRPSKIRSLMVQIVGRMKRLFPGKQYAEILDMAQLVSHHGFVDTDHYEPPQRGPSSDINKQFLDEATKHLKLEMLIAILDEQKLIPINRKLYDIKIDKLKSTKVRLNDMQPIDLINKMEVTTDPVTIIAIVVTLFSKLYGETYTAKNSKEVKNFRNPNAVTWISELWTELLPQQDEYHQRKYIKALKTRSRNMLKDKSSVWGLRFFIEFLIKEDTPEPELDTEESKPNPYTLEIDGIEVEIEDSDIPFGLLFLVPLLEYSSYIQGVL